MPLGPDEDGPEADPDLAGLLGAADLRQHLARPRHEPTIIAESPLITSSRHEPTSATRKLMITDGTIDDRAENTDASQSMEGTGDSDTEPDPPGPHSEHLIQKFPTPTVHLVSPAVLDVLDRPLGPFGRTLRNNMSGWIPKIFSVTPSTDLPNLLLDKQYMVYAFHEDILTLSVNSGAQLVKDMQIGIDESDWNELFWILSLIWTGRFAVSNLIQDEGFRERLDTIRDLILCYNAAVFHARGLELVLSSEPVTVDDALAISELVDKHEDAVAKPRKFWVIYIRAYPGEERDLDGA